MKSPLTHTFSWKKAVWPILFVLLLGLCAFFLFYELGDRGIVAYDEARHGVNAYEMLMNRDWVVHTYQGQVDYWNLKPPLSYWIIMLGYQLFGFTVFGLRFFTALSMLATMAIVSLWALRRHGKLASLLALVFFLASTPLYDYGSGRTADANAFYLLLTTIGLLCMLDSQRDIRWLYGTAICFGLSFMAKSYHAAILPLVALVYLIITGQLPKLKLKHYLVLIALALLPIAPWAIARYGRDGLAFFNAMVQTDVMARVASGPVGSDPWYYYLTLLLRDPAVVLGAAACLLGLGGKMLSQRKPTAEQIGFVLWMVLTVVVFSFAGAKLHHYIYSALIALAIPFGWSVDWLLRNAKRGFLLICCLALLATGFAAQIANTFITIDSQAPPHSFQTGMVETLDRDINAGEHMYIQYDPELSTWSQADVLCAEMAGDVRCIDGGLAAFLEDEETAMLVINKEDFPYDLLEYYPVAYEGTMVYILEN